MCVLCVCVCVGWWGEEEKTMTQGSGKEKGCKYAWRMLLRGSENSY